MVAFLLRMKGYGAGSAALLSLLLHITPASAASVRVVSSSEMDFPEGRQGVDVELRASGFEVKTEQTDALEPGKLLEELGADTPRDVVASVAVVRLGRGGIAYVWLSDEKQMYRVTSSETDTARAANVLSLRVVELISLGGSGFEVERSAPAPKPENRPPPKTPAKIIPPPAPLPWTAWIALGPGFGSGVKSPLSIVRLGLARRIGERLALEASGHVSPTSASQRYPEGDVRISDQGVSLSALLQNSGRLRWQLGPTAGLRCLRFQATQNDGSSTMSERVCSTSLGATGRVGAEWDSLSVWLSGLGAVSTRRIDLVSDGKVLSTLGRPEAWAGVMVGWSF